MTELYFVGVSTLDTLGQQYYIPTNYMYTQIACLCWTKTNGAIVGKDLKLVAKHVVKVR